MNSFTSGATHIILACGATDFRKQTESLSALVSMQLKLDPFESEYVFIFCNKRRNAIKVLRYDRNGFVLATKKLFLNQVIMTKKVLRNRRNSAFFRS